MTSLKETIQERLVDFHANTSDPRWSSRSLNDLLSFVVSSGGHVGDVVQTLYPWLAHPELSIELAHFIKDLTSSAFASFQESYRMSKMQWLSDELNDGCSAAQAYLALYSIPQDLLNPECVVAILKGLAATPFWDEAIANLEHEIDNAQVQALLREWFSSGTVSLSLVDLKRIVRNSR